MRKGFFSASALAQSAPPPLLAPRCGQCGLMRTCQSPKMPVAGRGLREILIVGESPGAQEDEDNLPFQGRAGQRLQETCRRLGVDLFRDCWVTNAIICRPPNRTPTAPEVDHCRPNVLRAIRELQPRVIVPLGAVAVRSVIGHYWREDPGPMTRWAGWRVPLHHPDCWLCPTYHPSFVLRKESEKGENPLPQLFFERHLREAFAREGRPWGPAGPPDYQSQVEAIWEPARAAAILRRMMERGGPVALDLETTTLKPDGPHSRIVCCAVCWRGRKTIAYPWLGEAAEATRELLVSAQPKVAANLKFEQRWTMRHLGVRVRRWVWDTMIAAHHQDNREGVTGLKFQAFVQLGVAPYDDHIKQFLAGPAPNLPNRIREIDLGHLLTYNALDALLEYKLAEIQTARLGLSLEDL